MKRAPLHLIIVSYPSTLDATLEEIAHTLARGATERRVVERAQAHTDLRYLLQLWHLRGHAIDRLDLIGHGGTDGRFKLGDHLLLGEGLDPGVLTQLGPFLAPRATLRVLGCGVVGGDAAPADVLRPLQRALGGRRRVLAPKRMLFAQDYGPAGLSPAVARTLVGSPTPRR